METRITRLRGKVALVTGSAQGIGKAIANRLAAEGATVAICDIQAELARDTAKEISTVSNSKSAAFALDVTNLESSRSAVAAVESELGLIDILVNNAGWAKIRRFADTAPELWDLLIDINFRGVLNCTMAVIPGMQERGHGRIVSVASDAGRAGGSGNTVYAGCKAAVIAFSKNLARELAPNKITVNCVCPGATNTALMRSLLADGHERLVNAMVRSTPMRRMAQPQDIANAVSFFTSADADFITGEVLSVNGGALMAG